MLVLLLNFQFEIGGDHISKFQIFRSIQYIQGHKRKISWIYDSIEYTLKYYQ